MIIFATIAAAPLAVLAATGAAAPLAAHSLSVPHASGEAAAEYRGEIAVAHRQIGAAAPAGRPSSLRCVWTASMAVDRTATTPAGALATRRFVQDDVARGSRTGWCAANRAAIARDVAAQVGDGSRHLARAAAADRGMLLTELDRHASAALGN